jgi:acetyl-CoA synthetase
VGGQLNLCYNCVDRHALGARRDKIALIWEGEPGEVRRLTYAELHVEVQKFANALKGLGIQKGDRVAIYMGMTPELAIALLACARIGAVHSVIFGGFAANAIADRVNDSACVAILTQDTSYRRGNEIQLKRTVDEAMAACHTVKHVVVYRRTGSPVKMVEGRDHWWHDLMAQAAPECPAEPLDSEDPLYILYTSGTTGKPKGLVHTTGGYAVQTYLTTKYVFDLHEEDIYWCTADIGWVTGHSYVVYGPLGQHLLHRAHRHSRLHQVGRPACRKVQARLPAPAGYSWRTHQPRGLDVVSREDRPQPLPHCGYLVAN